MKTSFILAIMLIAIVIAGCGSSSKSSSLPSPTTPSIAPANLTAYPGDQQVTLAWDPSPGAIAYYLYFYPENSSIRGNRQLLATTTSTTYTQFSITDGVPYDYFVTASNGAGASLPSEIIAIPSFMTSTTFTAGISLTWSAVTSPTAPSYYTLYYVQGQDTPVSGTSVTASASTYTFSSLTPGAYTFTVTAEIPNLPPDIRVGAPVTATIP